MKFLRKILPCLFVMTMVIMPLPVLADTGIIDQFNLAPFVPLVLDAMMTIASGGYDFFVGNGNGIIYLLFRLYCVCKGNRTVKKDLLKLRLKQRGEFVKEIPPQLFRADMV